jgi:hypothetical protein
MFNQAYLQHSFTASRIFTRPISVKGIDIERTQEPWFRENRVRGLNIPRYNLYSEDATDRPRTCILVGGMTSLLLPGFSSRDLVAVLVKYLENGMGRRIAFCPAYTPLASKDPPTKDLEELVRYCEAEHL